MICENRVQNVVFIPSLTHYSLLLKPLNVAALDFVEVYLLTLSVYYVGINKDTVKGCHSCTVKR